LCIIGRICNRCTDFVAITTAPNAKCQRVLVLTLCLVTLVNRITKICGRIFVKFLGTVYYGLEKSCFGFGMLGLGLAHLLLAGIDVWRGGGMPSTECPLVSISDDRTRLIIPVVRRRSRKRQNPEFGDKCFGENTSTFLEKSGRAMIELPLRKSASFFRSFCQVASVTERTVVNLFCWWLTAANDRSSVVDLRRIRSSGANTRSP